MTNPGAIVLSVALVLTSLGALLIGVWTVGLPAAGLRRAVAGALDCIGLGLLFFGANLVIGGVVVFLLRLVTGGFVSFYILDDGTILALSLLQGLIVRWWREGAR